MSFLTLIADYVFRPLTAAGTPRGADMGEVRTWASEVERVLVAAAASGGALVFNTKAELNAQLGYAQSTMAWVMGDSGAGNNGVYRKFGGSGAGSWAKIGNLPYQVIPLTNTGGTANAITATSTYPVAAEDGSVIVTLPVTTTNTSTTVTVSLNGEVLPLKTSSGLDPVVGGLIGGSIYSAIRYAGALRLLSDQATAAAAAAVEADRVATVAARDATLAALAAAEAGSLITPLATQAETDAGVTDGKWVSPLKLLRRLVASVALGIAARAVTQGGRYRFRAANTITAIQGLDAPGFWLEENTHASGDFSTNRLVAYFANNWKKTATHADGDPSSLNPGRNFGLPDPNGNLPYGDDGDAYLFGMQNVYLGSANNLRQVPKITANISSGVITSFSLGSAGPCFFNTAPTLIVQGDGTGATATAAITAGAVGLAQVVIDNGGSGYTSPPDVFFTGGGGTAATGVARIAGGKVVMVIITGTTFDFTSPPSISFSGGGGSGAAATAILARQITSVSVGSGGSGYTKAQVIVTTATLDPLDTGPVIGIDRSVEGQPSGSLLAQLQFQGRDRGGNARTFAGVMAVVDSDDPSNPAGRLAIVSHDPSNPGGVRIVANFGGAVYTQGVGDTGIGTINTGVLCADLIHVRASRTSSTIASSITRHLIDVIGSPAEGTIVANFFGKTGGSPVAWEIQAANAATWNAAAAAVKIPRNSSTLRSINAAGSVNTNGSDYAEFHRVVPGVPKVAKGDVIGLDAQDRITNRFADAIAFAIKTTNPAFVGGDEWAEDIGPPPERPEQIGPEERVVERTVEVQTRGPDTEDGRPSYVSAPMTIRTVEQVSPGESDEAYAARVAAWEIEHAEWLAAYDARRETVDRIAYAGRVPVNLTGAFAVGDYVLAQEGEDGAIVAVASATAPDPKRCVGRIRCELDDGRPLVAVMIG